MRVTCSGQLSLVFGLSVYTVEASAAAPLWGGANPGCQVGFRS